MLPGGSLTLGRSQVSVGGNLRVGGTALLDKTNLAVGNDLAVEGSLEMNAARATTINGSLILAKGAGLSLVCFEAGSWQATTFDVTCGSSFPYRTSILSHAQAVWRWPQPRTWPSPRAGVPSSRAELVLNSTRPAPSRSTTRSSAAMIRRPICSNARFVCCPLTLSDFDQVIGFPCTTQAQLSLVIVNPGSPCEAGFVERRAYFNETGLAVSVDFREVFCPWYQINVALIVAPSALVLLLIAVMIATILSSASCKCDWRRFRL